MPVRWLVIRVALERLPNLCYLHIYQFLGVSTDGFSKSQLSQFLQDTQGHTGPEINHIKELLSAGLANGF